MSFFLGIRPLQEPFDMGKPDANGRAQYVLNVRAEKHYSHTFVEELVRLLQTKGVGVEGTSLFFGSKVDVPTAGTVVVVRETGGTGPERIHNDLIHPNIQYPSASIICKSPTTEGAKAKAWQAYDAVTAVVNTTLTA